MRKPTIEEVRALQAETGEGVMYCKSHLQKTYAIEAVQNLPPKDSFDFDSKLGEILNYLINRAG